MRSRYPWPRVSIRLLPGVESRPKLPYVLLEHLRGGRGGLLVPQLLDQAVARDHLVRPEQQEREEGALSTLAQADRSPGVNDLEGTEVCASLFQ